MRVRVGVGVGVGIRAGVRVIVRVRGDPDPHSSYPNTPLTSDDGAELGVRVRARVSCTSDDGAERGEEVGEGLLLLRELDLDGRDVIDEEDARQHEPLGGVMRGLELVGDRVLARVE